MVTGNTGYEGVESEVEVVPVTYTNNNVISGWVMSNAGAGYWDQVGWIEGYEGGGCGDPQTTPAVFVQYNNTGNPNPAGGLPTYCYGYYLAQGTEYYFAITTINGDTNNWCNYLYYNNQWNYVGNCYNLPFYADQAQVEQNAEFVSLNGADQYPTYASNWSFDGTEVILLNGAGWIPWNGQIPTTQSYPNADNYMLPNSASYTAFTNYFTDWYASESPSPNFSMYTSPSSVTILPGQTGNTTLVLSTNSTYDSWYIGGINLSATALTSGNSASVSPSYVGPGPNQTVYATVTITTGLTQVSPYYVQVQGCGFVCNYTYVYVNPV